MSALDEILDTGSPADGTDRHDYEQPADELAVRRLLIDIARLERGVERTKELRRRVTHDYQEQERLLEERIAQARSIVQSYIENVNNGDAVSFPDVGTAYLVRRKPTIYVKDADAFEAWALEMGHVAVDVSGATKAAREQFKETGEIAHGCDVNPAETTLTVKR